MSTKSAAVSAPTFPSASEYAGMSRSEKAHTRTSVARIRDNALANSDFALAQSAHQWLTTIVGSSTTEKSAPDYTLTLAQRIAHLRTVAHLLASGDCVPDGIDSNDIDYDRLHALLSDDDDSLVDEQSARRDAIARITRRTERNAIQEVVDRAFADVPSGTFLTIADVAKRGGHPRGVAASGAIAARVDWDTLECSLDGVEPVERTANRARGFVKI